MKKKRKIIIGASVVIIVAALCVAFFINRASGNPADACTSKDRSQNNCVPAGRCTPLGDPSEASTDCAIKNYDHKFNSDK